MLCACVRFKTILNQPANLYTGLCIANSGCTALYCSCAYQTRAPLLYFDPYLLLGFGVQIIEIRLGRATLIYGTQPVILNVCIDMQYSAYSFRPLLKYSCKLRTIYIIMTIHMHLQWCSLTCTATYRAWLTQLPWLQSLVQLTLKWHYLPELFSINAEGVLFFRTLSQTFMIHCCDLCGRIKGITRALYIVYTIMHIHCWPQCTLVREITFCVTLTTLTWGRRSQ